MADIKETIGEIPEKSKEYSHAIQEGWNKMSIPEKSGVVALEIIGNPIIAFGVFEFLRRHEEKKIKKVA